MPIHVASPAQNRPRPNRSLRVGSAALVLAAVIVGVQVMAREADLARASRARADAAQLAKSIARLRSDTANTTTACLTNLNNLTATSVVPSCGSVSAYHVCSTTSPRDDCWSGPYVTTIVNDPWNNPYTASLDATSYAITVRSAGPDRVIGSDDDVTYQQ